MRNHVRTAVALAAAGSIGAVALVVPAQSAPTRPDDAKVSTPFAIRASGFGTRVGGGQVPAGSHQTAYTALGCSSRAGLDRENHEAAATLPGLGTVSGVKTRLWSRKIHGVVHSYSRNSTARVVLAQSGVGKLRITAVGSLSHAYHDARGFHAATRSSIGTLQFVPTGGDPQELDLPTPGQPIEVPGLATIWLGSSTKRADSNGATAAASALRVRSVATGSRAVIAHTSAQVLAGVRHGQFRGYSAGTRVSAADDAITSGRTPLSLMPCQGTYGAVETKAIADIDLGGQIVVQGLRSQQRARELPRKSVAFERGAIAGIDIGGGALVVDAVIGQANVTRPAVGKTRSSTRGSLIGAITANGEQQELPDTGVLEIPGVAKIRPMIVKRTAFGISVVALRIILLDGSGAVIDLGVARAKIR